MLPRLNQRYQSVRPLGRGGQGTVWLARDQHVPGREVAVKLLASAGRPTEHWREFAVLRRLRHPGLAAVWDMGQSEEGAPFIVSDFIAGATLNSWAAGRPLEQTLPAMCRVLGTLDFVHRRGVVHRDIKPSNVLVSDAAVTLVDFGMAMQLGQRPRSVGGTVGYIAPELLSDGVATAASDLYAVGVMLYGLIWQQKPFEGEAEQVAQRQVSEEVLLPPSTLPASLLGLVKQLLARDPALRPQSAAEVLESLELVPGFALAPARRYLVGDGLPEPLLVGRGTEVAVADHLLDQLRASATGVKGVLVLGPPGAGRTRFIEELVSSALLAGLWVQRGFPATHPDGVAAAAVEPNAEQARAISSIVQSMRQRTQGPGVLVVDGPKDQQTAQVLAALEQQEDLPLLICVSSTPGDALEQQLSARFLRIEIGGLSEEETCRAVSSMLPRQLGGGELGRAVYRRSGGNPRRMGDLVRIAVDRLLQLAQPVDLAELVELPETTADHEGLAALRAAALPPDQRAAAQVIALFEWGVANGLLSQLEPGLRHSAVEALLMQGVVGQLEDGRLMVTGRTLARALLALLPVEEREALLTRALDLLRQQQAAPHHLALLVHRADLGPRYVELLLEGARGARGALDLSTSVRLYRAAASAAAEPAARRTHQRELAQVLLATGQHSEAIELLQQLAREARGQRAVEAACTLADAQLRAGHAADALQTLAAAAPAEQEPAAEIAALRAKARLFAGSYGEVIEAARPAVDASNAAIAADARQSVALGYLYQGKLEQALVWAERAADLARRGDDELLRARVFNTLAMVLQRQLAFARAAEHYRACLEMARACGHLPFQATFQMNLASVAHQQGELRDALDGYRQSLQLARRFGGLREMAQVLHNLGGLLAYLGQHERAVAHLRRSRLLADSIGWRALAAHDTLVEAEVDLDRGEVGAAERGLGRASSVFAVLEDQMGLALCRVGLARCRLAAGRTEEALQLATEVMAQTGELEEVRLRARIVAASAQLELAQGEPGQLLQSLREAHGLAQRLSQPELLIELNWLLARACGWSGAETQAREHQATLDQLLLEQTTRLPTEMWSVFRAAIRRRCPRGSDEVTPEVSITSPTVPGSGSASGRRGGAPHTPAAALQPPGWPRPASAMGALLGVATKLASPTGLRGVLQAIADQAAQQSEARRAFVLLSRGRQLSVVAVHGADAARLRNVGDDLGRALAEAVVSSGEELVTPDAMSDARCRRWLREDNGPVGPAICLPVQPLGETRAALYVDRAASAPAFSPGDLLLLRTLASQAAVAIATRELEQLQLEQQQELEQKRRLLQQQERTIARQRRELARLRAMLPGSSHQDEPDGPGEAGG